MCLIVYSNDHAPLTVRLIYSSSKLRTVQMMIFSLVAMIGLAKCCITSACLQWLCHSGERIVARGPLVFYYFSEKTSLDISCESSAWQTICMKCQDLFSLKKKKKKKKKKKLLSAAVVIGVLRVK